jgi:N-acyl-D-amino-acid deacylase
VDEAVTFAHPIKPAIGIEAVITNGTIVWRDGKSTGARPGRVLRRTPG